MARSKQSIINELNDISSKRLKIIGEQQKIIKELREALQKIYDHTQNGVTEGVAERALKEKTISKNFHKVLEEEENAKLKAEIDKLKGLLCQSKYALQEDCQLRKDIEQALKEIK